MTHEEVILTAENVSLKLRVAELEAENRMLRERYTQPLSRATADCGGAVTLEVPFGMMGAASPGKDALPKPLPR